MEIAFTFLGTLWRFMSWLPGFVLRRFFSKKWLADHTKIDVRSRHDPVSIRGGELPEIHIWLVVTNFGYFPIELDRISVEFTFASVLARFQYLRRTEIKSGGSAEIFIRGTLTGEQAAHIGGNRERPMVALQVLAEFNSKVHNFSTDTGQMSGIRPELANF